MEASGFLVHRDPAAVEIEMGYNGLTKPCPDGDKGFDIGDI
jgi:hypothetical protein